MRLTLAVPALVQLAQALDERIGEAESPGQPLRHFAVPGEALLGQLRKGEQSTRDDGFHSRWRLVRVRLPYEANSQIHHLGDVARIDGGEVAA